jgi:hypothetical protein
MTGLVPIFGLCVPSFRTVASLFSDYDVLFTIALTVP